MSQSRSLADRLNDGYAAPWRPEAGDSLVGKVTEISTSNGGEYGPYPIVTVSNDKGESLAVHAFHTVLKSAFIKASPAIGETVAVKYNGLRLGKGGVKGTEYHDYRVIVDRLPVDVWGKFTTAVE